MLKTSLTAAGCYLSPAPGSKGTKIIVSCFLHGSLSSKTEILNICFNKADQKKPAFDDELRRITSDAKSFSDNAAIDVQFLDAASESVLSKARDLNLLSESTYETIGLLQRDETNRFITKPEDKSVDESADHETNNIASSSDKVHLLPGKDLYFMNRFLIRWNLSNHQCQEACRGNCPVRGATTMEVRHMVESDWLYLAELSKSSNRNHSASSSYKALKSLKHIPAAARRSFPVLVDHSGLLLSVPAIGFSYCPCLKVSTLFLPRVPLGGGFSSFL